MVQATYRIWTYDNLYNPLRGTEGGGGEEKRDAIVLIMSLSHSPYSVSWNSMSKVIQFGLHNLGKANFAYSLVLNERHERKEGCSLGLTRVMALHLVRVFIKKESGLHEWSGDSLSLSIFCTNERAVTHSTTHYNPVVAKSSCSIDMWPKVCGLFVEDI